MDQIYKLFTQYPVICTDTRKIEPGCIFFALKGPNFNANELAGDALEKGAAYAVIDEGRYKKDDRYIVTQDVLAALQELATFHRNQLNIPVIAIVGSNGKTTTKELITSLLSEKYQVLATPGNFNNHIGLPLTLLKLNRSHEIAVIEMGANHIGENALLCEIARPTLGLVTNNGKDHLEGFGSMEGVAQSNSELYYYLHKHNGTAFVNANDEWLMRMASRLDKKITYAANYSTLVTKADCCGYASALQPEIRFTIESEPAEISSSLSGSYNFDNIMAAVAISRHFSLDMAQIKKGVEKYVPQNNRSQVVKKERNTIYLDAYNANPSSMEASLTNFAAMPFGNKVAILGDMFELGKYAEEEHRHLINVCTRLPLDEVILVGRDFHKQNLENRFTSFETTAEAREYISGKNYSGMNIFMKGSRGMKLETLSEVIG